MIERNLHSCLPSSESEEEHDTMHTQQNKILIIFITFSLLTNNKRTVDSQAKDKLHPDGTQATLLGRACSFAEVISNQRKCFLVRTT
ncbi:hypothetical protein SAMN02745181_0519 [Rubritalea squalenifaciens DSM 18772]|uniref:Uncharacterized protein n=1 Tax=Rubritalea squalenifaciens DSM 18772 TaxID=1123071 RepID=A0A1M6CMQ0_9BACT|nr:hypothetical protein SAMN02745181_0519 [Rubritalea squalenifaciens DSM 18772]